MKKFRNYKPGKLFFGLALLALLLLGPGTLRAATNGGAPNQPQLLRGRLCSWSGSSGGGSSFSTTYWARFDGRGRFVYGSESSYSGGNGSMNNGGAEGGGTYEVRGNRIILRYDEGGVDVAAVHNRAADGRITEVMFEGRLYAAALCE
jgi:hypothetical protein